jgi:hypothetical protein
VICLHENIAVLIGLLGENNQKVNDGHGHGITGPAHCQIKKTQQVLLLIKPVGTGPAQEDTQQNVLLLVDLDFFPVFPAVKEVGDGSGNGILVIFRFDAILFLQFIQFSLSTEIFFKSGFPLDLLVGLLGTVGKTVGILQKYSFLPDHRKYKIGTI